MHGVEYGPSESILGRKDPSRLDKPFRMCKVKKSYRASCGHLVRTIYSKAFELAADNLQEHPCYEQTRFQNPIGGHQIDAKCSLKTACMATPPLLWI